MQGRRMHVIAWQWKRHFLQSAVRTLAELDTVTPLRLAVYLRENICPMMTVQQLWITKWAVFSTRALEYQYKS